MLSPAPETLTEQQNIVRETTFYRDAIKPLIDDGIEHDQKPLLIRIPKPLSGEPSQIIQNYLEGIAEIATQAGHQDPLSNRRVIFLINQGNAHWTVFSTDGSGALNPQHSVTSDGTCGLSSALVVCKEISKADGSQAKYNNVITESISAANIPTNAFTFDDSTLKPLIPNDTKVKVSSLVAIPSNTDFWLIDADITEIINHNEPNKFRNFNGLSLLNKTDRAHQINFATAYNNTSSYAGNFSELLPNSTDYRSVQYFYDELDPIKLKAFLSHHSKREGLADDAKKNLYKICEQYSLFKEDDEKIKFDLGDCNEKTAIDQEILLMKSKLKDANKISQELMNQSAETLKVSEFFQNRFNQAECTKFLQSSSIYFPPNNPKSFKDKLFNLASSIDQFFFKYLKKENLPSLPQKILKIIVPKSCQPDTQDYKGWGKVINSKTVDGKTTLELDGKIIQSIDIDGEDKLKEILELKNSYLINCAILDLFRNTDDKDIIVGFRNGRSEFFNHHNRKTIIGNQIVEKPTPKEEALLTETHLDVAQRIYVEKISEKGKFLEASPDDFKKIKEHIEKRFKLLEEQLSLPNSNAIIVIPGYYDDNTKKFQHALATGYAIEQWGNKIYSDEIKDFIESKITTLQSNHSEKILFGNVGTEVVTSNKKTFYPQFPVGDQTWAEFEIKFKANIADITPEAKKALIKNYETNLGWNDSKTPIEYTAASILGDDAKLDHILTHLKTNFTDKNFIHVWGANANNWNCSLNSWKGGGGQATAFTTQERGVFGITTTPVAGSKDLMKPCKTYQAPSAQPASPSAVAAAVAAAGIVAGGN